MIFNKIRTGIGYDVHQLADGEVLIIGGVAIKHTKGTIAHSDGDVLIHALCDAILGAAALGDIGTHFPDTDPSLKGIESTILLKKTCILLEGRGYSVGNIDCVVCLQKPKIAVYIPLMKESLAKVMSINESQINIKATTTEKLGFVGREEGVSAYVSVLIVENNFKDSF